jgi:hypothetical protein
VIRSTTLAFFVAPLLAAFVSQPASTVRIGTVRYSLSDFADYSRTSFDDSSWPKRWFVELPSPGSVLWVRTEISLPIRGGTQHVPVGVAVAALASHEMWWDGVPVGRGGVVGTSATSETPGPIEIVHAIPDSLTAPGIHTIALRTSAFHRGFAPPNGYWSLEVGPYDELVTRRSRGAWIALVSASGILLGALLAFVIFGLQPRDRSSLWLGLLSLAFAVLLAIEAWRPLLGYTYDRHFVRLLALCVTSWIACGLLVTYVTARFPERRASLTRAIAIPLLAAPMFLAPSWNDKVSFMELLAFAFAAAWTARAVGRRRRGAIPALIGLVLALALCALQGPLFLDRWLYFSADVLIAMLLLGHLLEWHDQILSREQAIARSARLEAELFKRHLQPHFVMNTLTAIGGWIEEDPPTAVRMIDALAEELRILARISDRKLIPLADELRLCRAHLETMGLRRDSHYRLETEGIDESEMIPPALIHTLLENAITHGPEATGERSFRLAAARSNGRTQYTFTSPLGEARSDDAGSGSGTRYLAARLREAWGRDWTLEQHAEGEVWRVDLDVPRALP